MHPPQIRFLACVFWESSGFRDLKAISIQVQRSRTAGAPLRSAGREPVLIAQMRAPL